VASAAGSASPGRALGESSPRRRAELNPKRARRLARRSDSSCDGSPALRSTLAPQRRRGLSSRNKWPSRIRANFDALAGEEERQPARLTKASSRGRNVMAKSADSSAPALRPVAEADAGGTDFAGAEGEGAAREVVAERRGARIALLREEVVGEADAGREPEMEETEGWAMRPPDPGMKRLVCRRIGLGPPQDKTVQPKSREVRASILSEQRMDAGRMLRLRFAAGPAWSQAPNSGRIVCKIFPETARCAKSACGVFVLGRL